MSHDFIQNAVNALYRDNELMALKAENARLKAEVERLEANMTKLCTHGDAEISRLKAEVERLTKAGDAMAGLIQAIYEGEFSGLCEYEELKAWHAAKGVQS